MPRARNVQPGKHVCADLLAGADPRLIREMEPYVAGLGAPWARAIPAPAEETLADAEALESEWKNVEAAWAKHIAPAK